jgi:hypothetical protein
MTPVRTGPVPAWVVDGLVAGAVAGVVSGLPSTVAAVRQGTGVLAATRAAGTLLGRPTAVRGAVAHVALSLGWGVVLSGLGPHRGTVGGGAVRLPVDAAADAAAGVAAGPETDLVVGALAGVVAGAVIAAVDLVVVGRRILAIRRLPQLSQWLDHLLFGAVVGVVLARRSKK